MQSIIHTLLGKALQGPSRRVKGTTPNALPTLVPHSGNNVDMQCVHLTNYAVNKGSDKFVAATEESGGSTGSKRDFAFLNQFLAESGADPTKIWGRIDSLIVKTLLAGLPELIQVYNSCFPQVWRGMVMGHGSDAWE